MGNSLSPDSLLEVSLIPCLHSAIGEEINKLSLLLDSPLVMFFHHWITTWVGCLCIGTLAMLRAIGCSMGWALTAAVSLHGMRWATSHCHTMVTYSNLTPHFGHFTPKEKNYFCCHLGPKLGCPFPFPGAAYCTCPSSLGLLLQPEFGLHTSPNLDSWTC